MRVFVRPTGGVITGAVAFHAIPRSHIRHTVDLEIRALVLIGRVMDIAALEHSRALGAFRNRFFSSNRKVETRNKRQLRLVNFTEPRTAAIPHPLNRVLTVRDPRRNGKRSVTQIRVLLVSSAVASKQVSFVARLARGFVAVVLEDVAIRWESSG